MPDENSSHPENQSEIPIAEIPKNGFSSQIPAYLLDGKSEAEAYILTEVSKMSQFIEWAAPLLVDNNLQARKTNGKVKRLERWKLKLTTGWGMVVTVFGFILAVIGGIQGLVAMAEYLHK